MELLPETRQQLAAGAFSGFQYDDNIAVTCGFVRVQCVGVGLCASVTQIRFKKNGRFGDSSFGKN